MKKYLVLCIALTSVASYGAKLNLTDLEIPVTRTVRTLNPETGKFESKTERLSDAEIEQVIHSMKGTNSWSVQVGTDWGKELGYIAGGHGGSGAIYEQRQAPVSSKIMSARDGKIVFNKIKGQSLKFDGQVNFTSDSSECKYLGLSLYEGKVSVNSIYNKEGVLDCRIDIVNPLNKHFGQAMTDLELRKNIFEKEESNCEVGFDLTAKEIRDSIDEVREACENSNFRNCAKEPSLTRVVAKNLKLSILERASGKMREEYVDVVTAPKERSVVSEFISKNGEVLLTSYRKEIGNEACGFVDFK